MELLKPVIENDYEQFVTLLKQCKLNPSFRFHTLSEVLELKIQHMQNEEEEEITYEENPSEEQKVKYEASIKQDDENLKMIKLLIENGADPAVINRDDHFPWSQLHDVLADNTPDHYRLDWSREENRIIFIEILQKLDDMGGYTIKHYKNNVFIYPKGDCGDLKIGNIIVPMVVGNMY